MASPPGDRPQVSNKPVPAMDPSPPARKPARDPDAQLVDRRVKRHGRREQLYVAIRETMIRSGVLSSSYKFKVLSLDQRGDQFLVMMEMASGLGHQADKLAEIETLMIGTAKSLFNIYVTSVYWRTDGRPAAANAVNFGASQPVDRDLQPTALAVASASTPATPDGTGKNRSGLRSFTLLTGFEDTEMPESSAPQALSTSQYGELR